MAWRNCRLAATALLIAATPAAGADGPRGIAFFQAPEQGGGVCVGATADEAFSCAIAQCMESGALEDDCIKTNWCDPAGWSVDIFVQHREGPHWHEVVCGLPSKAVALATAAHVCDRTERGNLIECSPVQVYDPEGKEQIEW